MRTRHRYTSPRTLRCGHRQKIPRFCRTCATPRAEYQDGPHPGYCTKCTTTTETEPQGEDPPLGYCNACWTEALARDFTPEEWAELHALAKHEAYNQPENQYKPLRGYTPSPAPKPRRWKSDAEAIASITKAIAQMDDARAHATIGTKAGYHRQIVTDGHRALLVADAEPGPPMHTGYAAYQETERYHWIALPLGFDLVVRRVQTVASDRTAAIRLAIGDFGRLVVSTSSPEHGTASEWIPIDPWHAPDRQICVNGEYLLDALGGPCWFGMPASDLEPCLIRAESDAWRYVLMGMRE